MHHHFPGEGRASKLFTGLNAPKAGPIFPNEEAAPPIEVGKSSPKDANPIAPIINANI